MNLRRLTPGHILHEPDIGISSIYSFQSVGYTEEEYAY